MLNIKFGKLLFSLDITEDFIVGERIKKFICNDDSFKYKINVKVNYVDTFQSLNCKIVQQIDDRLLVMRDDTDTFEYRLFFHPTKKIPYALYREGGNNNIELDVLTDVCPQIVVDTEFFEHVALEKHLLKTNSVILHSSSILVDGEAILFSAPSGTGKSTQANLWNKFRNSEIINGDRNILRITDKGIYVEGLPFCGTSGIYKNITVPLKGIVVLEQGQEDKIVELNKMEKFTKIFSELTMNNWNIDSVDKVINLCNDIISNTTMCKLTCTMNETAVECLEKYLEDNNETI